MELIARVLAGDIRAAARACRLVDDRAPGHRELLAALYAAAPVAHVVGVTGSPGAGKSTLVDRLVSSIRARGGPVAVVAVDPSSPFSGGALLGDRIRMQRHFEDPGVFIRSVATRGALGGLSRSARDIARVLEVWGASVVLIETVGVGQDEVDVTRAADTTVVVLTPGQGDDVQASKAGILECADVLVVNKADQPFADGAVRDLEGMLALGAISQTSASSRHTAALAPRAATGDGWTPPIVKTVASEDRGTSELLARIEEHRVWLSSEPGRSLRAARMRGLLESWVRDEAAGQVHGRPDALARAADRVLAREIDPHAAVDELLLELRRP